MADAVKLTKLADCAGCGAKVGAGMLARLFEGFSAPRDPNLIVGFDHADDAAVYRLAPDLAIVETVDFFPPMVDDPYVFGQVAAANALSDLYAMGARPIMALNIMAVPEDMPQDAVRAMLRGGAAMVAEAGASLAGGHSIYDAEPKYGMAVTGVVDPARIVRNDTAQVGDALVYTKPLGIGIAATAVKGGVAHPDLEEAMVDAMVTLNRAAAEVMMAHAVHAATDITGFAVLGHVLEMVTGADAAAELDPDAFLLLPGVRDLAAMGILPAAVYRNRRYAEGAVEAGSTPLDLADVLYDPETSGGLMMAVAAADAPALVDDLVRAGVPARRVGRIVAPDAVPPGKRIVLTAR